MHKLRKILSELLPPLLLVGGFAMSWIASKVLVHSSCPMLVVTSQSMAPAFHRGDVIFLSNRSQDVSIGDIPVAWIPGNGMPFVHRAIAIHWEPLRESNGSRSVTASAFEICIPQAVADSWLRQLILTKGDNNELDDVALYPPGRQYIYREEIVGFVRGYVPKLGLLSLGLKWR